LIRATGEDPRSWYQKLNPFASRITVDLDVNEEYPQHGPMALRAIAMKDFELAVAKAKQAKSHCGIPSVLRQRVELD